LSYLDRGHPYNPYPEYVFINRGDLLYKIFFNLNIIRRMLCEYKAILGKPGQGIHSYRIFNIAIVDVLMTVLAAYIFHLLVPRYRFWVILMVLFLLGIILHRLFCVKTTIDKLLFN